jgi:hypothetical protein
LIQPIRTEDIPMAKKAQRLTRCFSLLIGARNTPRGGERFQRADERTIRKLTVKYFPNGFTILNAKGVWYDAEKKKFVREESRQILISTSNRRLLLAWGRRLGRELSQKELILVELGPVRTLRIAQ